MKEKLKRVLVIFGITILLIPILIFLYSDLYMLINIYNKGSQIDQTPKNEEKIETEALELMIWKDEREIEYLENYCDIASLLPAPESAGLKVSVNRYTKPMLIETSLNPYPGYTNISVIGDVTNDDIEGFTSNMKLYRIELIKDSQIYVEYLSDRDTPNLYLVQDENRSTYLIYPMLAIPVSINTDFNIIVE